MSVITATAVPCPFARSERARAPVGLLRQRSDVDLVSAGGTIDNTLSPVMGKPRIQALDVIRGVSILGILAVNADGYAAPIGASLNPVTWLYPNTGATAIAYWVMDVFFHEKFVTLFSMLFGISLFLVGGERSNKQKSRILWRRLAALMVFALIHGFGIWWGDILFLYACTGSIMLFCRSWGPRRLMVVGLLLYLLMVLHTFSRTTPLALRDHPGGSVGAQRTDPQAPVVIEKRKAAIAVTVLEARSSWAGAYRVNARTYVHQLQNIPWQMPLTLSLMMIGLSLFKSGFLSGQASTPRYQVMMATGAAALCGLGCMLWVKDVRMGTISGEKALEMLLSPFVSLLFASALILLVRAGTQFLVTPLAAAGRMAFTNYLTQSIVMTSIFYGGRGALMGEMNRGALWGLVVAIWLLQLIWSPLWLKRFDMGPFEWAWRCMTYGQRVPFLKSSRS